MNEEIFRQKSLTRIKSPENLDDYIRVSNPSVWLLLITVIILLIGACVWGVYGRIDSTVRTSIYAENGIAVCYIADKDISSVKKGMTVSFNNLKAIIAEIGQKETKGYACSLQAEPSIPDGVYEGKIVTSSVKPLYFILN